ncbi:Mpo1 family 2-hydroxy fatty acid dioxygenase [Marilutibacter alkalisoli]|uniref:DUF962 domain-containing protein n=1 Tax=Marilutibacter alkalisoli TaxID=2591633 RepID=A0A514BUM8_9GAMM|nr:Mpo1-like protein [Lysobacter alkalisoli]QDH71072.1 DUF962 domain-containing protein [Lysobacter alkalisoli]
MNTATDTPREPATSRRQIDVWFDSYSADHRNPANQLIHVICVPAILWSVIALLWCIPSPGTWFRAGFWAGVAMFVAWAYYYRASRRLAFGMLAVFVAMAWATRWLHGTFGTMNLLYLAVGVFVVAWIGQFVGHSKLFEGRKPSFLTDLRYLLVGPAWVLAKLYRKLGWGY